MKFVLFGCWNQIDCEKNSGEITLYKYRDIVLDSIKKNEKDYDFLVVAGDNWYSNKKESEKYYYTNVLKSGFIKLYELGKECHIILGNHDEDKDNEEIFDDDIIKLKKNCMLNTEKYYLHNVTKAESFMTPSLEYLYENSSGYINEDNLSKLILHESLTNIEYITKNNNAIVFINTNIFSEHLYPRANISEYINKIETVLDSLKDSKNIFVIGHFPITSYTIKNGKNKFTRITSDNNLLNEFIRILTKYRAIYLAADTHNFQTSIISKKLVQIVSGTGGASPDTISEYSNTTSKYKLDNYNIEFYSHNSYGYTVIEILDSSIIITYKKIIDSNNNIINMEYVYELKYDGDGEGDAIMAYKDARKIFMDLALDDYKTDDICNNLNEINVIMDNKNLHNCYKKIKK